MKFYKNIEKPILKTEKLLIQPYDFYLYEKSIEMKELVVKRFKINTPCSIQEIARLLDAQTLPNAINTVNWKSFSYVPKVNFRIGHTGNEIWLKFEVNEKHIRAVETKINGEVYKDSTVEFFISLDGKNYYNFEFNCIGTQHLSFGPGRGNRTRITPEIVKKIEIKSSLGQQPFIEKTGNFNWEMVIKVPKECFVFDKTDSFSGIIATANFYKCGDATSTPHYITWNPIKTENPDYHRPEFFGKIYFE